MTNTFGQKSEDITEIAKALCKVQAKIEGAKKDSVNPYFKSKYADLEAVWDSVRDLLTENGLSVAQTMGVHSAGEAAVSTLVTTLMHESGQYISGEMPLLLKQQDPQGQGSSITYARRYALAAILGVYQVDDDAETAVAPKRTSSFTKPSTPTVTTDNWNTLNDLGKKNGWHSAHMRLWIENQRAQGKSDGDIYQDGLDKFGKQNLDRLKEEAPF